MIIDTNIFRDKNNRKSKSYLIKCDSCGIEKWYRPNKCNNGKRKFCSTKCINSGRKHSDKWKTNMSLRNSGINNPFYGKKHTLETKLKCIEIGKEAHKIFKSKLTSDQYSNFLIQKSLRVVGCKNHFYGKTHTQKTKTLISEKAIARIFSDDARSYFGSRGIRGIYVSSKTLKEERYDSLYERIYMEFMDQEEEIEFWTKLHGIKIPYVLNEVCKTYVPDFYVKKSIGIEEIIEIKGYENKEKLSMKLKSLEDYCQKNGIGFKFVGSDDIYKLVEEKFNKTYRMYVKEHKNA